MCPDDVCNACIYKLCLINIGSSLNWLEKRHFMMLSLMEKTVTKQSQHHHETAETSFFGSCARPKPLFTRLLGAHDLGCSHVHEVCSPAISVRKVKGRREEENSINQRCARLHYYYVQCFYNYHISIQQSI